VHVVTYGQPAYEKVRGIDGGFFQVHRTGHPSVPKVFALPLRMIRLSLLIIKVVKQNNCDLIYVQDLSIAGIPSVLASKITGKPLIMKFVGDWAWETAYSRKWTQKLLHDFYDSNPPNIWTSLLIWLQKFVCRNGKRIVTPSNYLRSIIEKWGINTPIEVISNATEFYGCNKDNSRRELNLNGTILLSVGRLVSWKGFEKVIEVIKNIKKDISYLIIGDGPDKENLEDLIRKYELDNVHLVGRMPKDIVLNYICASDIFVLPSLYEGMSHVILEAMVNRTPVVASNVCGNPEIITHRKSGFLVNPSNPEELKEVITDLIDGGINSRKISDAAFDFVRKNNSWETHIENLNMVFEDVKLERS
jgi:glycosyltransferase involved in cell wall biosynthesis